MKKLLIFGMVLFMSVAAGSAYANFSLNFGPVFSGTNPTGYLTATFTDVASGQVQLVISSNLSAATEFVSDVYFNFTQSNLTGLNFALGTNTTPVTPTVSTGTDAFKADGDGFFDIQLAFGTSPKALTSGQSVTYTITDPTFTGFNASYFDTGSSGGTTSYLAAAHVQGIPATGGGTTSGWSPGTPVPIPAAVWLLGSGLLGLIGIGRRMKLG